LDAFRENRRIEQFHGLARRGYLLRKAISSHFIVLEFVLVGAHHENCGNVRILSQPGQEPPNRFALRAGSAIFFSHPDMPRVIHIIGNSECYLEGSIG
jgi:hypothetical protein